jgi:transcriptional regulator with XRE-family HTH domain
MAQISYSTALLARVREGMKRRGLNRAALAKRLGMDRRELRAVLAEREPLTVDQFFAMVEALELSPLELGVPADLAGLQLEEPPEPPPEEPEETTPEPAPTTPPQALAGEAQ